MILRYQKVTDQYTTYTLNEPDYSEDTDIRCVELCTLEDGYTYVYAPDDIVLPEQSEQINIDYDVILTDDLVKEIKENSPHVRLINERIVEKIRKRYSLNDELKVQRINDQEGLDYIKSCVDWGKTEKEKIGLY